MDYYVHAPVNVNLAAPKATRSIKIINAILDQGVKCIVHCGVSDDYDNISNNLAKLSKGAILENSAGQSRQLGSSIADIKRIVKGIKVPLCIDTQHAFAAGVTRWDSLEESRRILDRYNKISKIVLIHLNDSAVEFNSHVDRHSVPTKGYIWKKKENREGLWGILQWCEERDVDVVIEMNDQLGGVEILRSIRDLYTTT
jgi:endonuclease IV